MSENEIKDFVAKTLNQIKDALPEGFDLEGRLNFDISVTTTKESSGKIDISLAGANLSGSTQQVHRINFAVLDSVAQKKNLAQATLVFKNLFAELNKMDKQLLLPAPKKIKRR
ncbi:MAG: hypothetical protein WC821_01155 [archaeon]|jgi:hypothetical protein